MESKDKIIQNAVFSRYDNKFYKSTHRHDFVSFPISEDKTGFIDGGEDYIRCSFNSTCDLIEDYSLYASDSLRIIHEKLLWGTYGKDGKESLTYVLLKDRETSHLNAIKKIGKEKLCPYVWAVINIELQFREGVLV
jgi:hypothetical protein